MNKETIRHWLQFLSNGIWRITEDEVTPVQRRTQSAETASIKFSMS